MRSNTRDDAEVPSPRAPSFGNRANTRQHCRLNYTYLTRDGREPAHKGVTVVAARRAIVIVLDDDSLLARVAALKDNNNLTGLRTYTTHYISSVISFASHSNRALAHPRSRPQSSCRDRPHARHPIGLAVVFARAHSPLPRFAHARTRARTHTHTHHSSFQTRTLRNFTMVLRTPCACERRMRARGKALFCPRAA